MAKKRLNLCALLLALTFLLTGCWDASDVNNLNLSTMVILDKQDGKFTFTVEIAKIAPSGNGGSGGTRQVYVKGSGSSFADARDNLDMKLDQPLYLATVRSLVITEHAAENDLAEYLFRLREDQSYRQKVYITITDEDPDALTKAENETEQPAGFVIDDTIHTAIDLGHTFAITTVNLINAILAKRSFLVQHIGLADNQIMLTGYSVFRDAKLVGFIPMEGAHGLAYLLTEPPVWVYRMVGSEMSYTVEAQMTGKRIQPMYSDGKIRFQVQLDFDAMVQYPNEVHLFPLNDARKQEVSETLSAMLKREVENTVRQSQEEFQCDYLMFGEAFRLTYPDAFEQMDWNAEYLNAEFEVSVSVDVAVSDKLDLEAD
ncbi:MAG TPA: Ger(x)C family spore germination protein [Clostridia bacterium]|nr:Ger(x)C family spore germination protein [Clostridia bacterium]